MWVYYNPNPYGERVGDCSVRAVSKALDLDWDKAYTGIALTGFVMKDMPSSNAVWGSYIRSKGFVRRQIPDVYPDRYTAERFCADHPQGAFVLVFSGHVATVKDGNLFDTWDSSAELPLYYYEKLKEEEKDGE